MKNGKIFQTEGKSTHSKKRPFIVRFGAFRISSSCKCHNNNMKIAYMNYFASIKITLH